jgi:hypothetical protein
MTLAYKVMLMFACAPPAMLILGAVHFGRPLAALLWIGVTALVFRVPHTVESLAIVFAIGACFLEWSWRRWSRA